MAKPENTQPLQKESHLVQCAGCSHFGYFPNDLGHNSPHALGRCGAKPWDGNEGQWAMFQHPCRGFREKEPGGDG
jgi:hypothetical protein